MILWGESQIGKTQFALAHFKTPLMISHMDRLTTFDPRVHDGIVFDDMSFTHLHQEAQIHLVDINNTRDIHVRYLCAHIPRKTKKIFTTNKDQGRIFDTDYPAIANRLQILECEGNHSDKKRQRVGCVGNPI